MRRRFVAAHRVGLGSMADSAMLVLIFIYILHYLQNDNYYSAETITRRSLCLLCGCVRLDNYVVRKLNKMALLETNNLFNVKSIIY